MEQPMVWKSWRGIPPGGFPRGWAQQPCSRSREEGWGTGWKQGAQHVLDQQLSPSSALASQSSSVRGTSGTAQLLLTALPDSSDTEIKTVQSRIMQKAICLLLSLNKRHDHLQKALFLNLPGWWMSNHSWVTSGCSQVVQEALESCRVPREAHN